MIIYLFCSPVTDVIEFDPEDDDEDPDIPDDEAIIPNESNFDVRHLKKMDVFVINTSTLTERELAYVSLRNPLDYLSL